MGKHTNTEKWCNLWPSPRPGAYVRIEGLTVQSGVEWTKFMITAYHLNSDIQGYDEKLYILPVNDFGEECGEPEICVDPLQYAISPFTPSSWPNSEEEEILLAPDGPTFIYVQQP